MALANDGRRTRGAVEQIGEVSGRVAYESDPYSWALQQATWIRDGRLDLIDTANIADEIADVARREAKSTRSALRLVMQHLLKWDLQSDRRSRSWVLTIRTQRREVDRQLADNPGLRSQVDMLVRQAYPDARDAAIEETGLPEAAIPTICPYAWDDIMSRPIEWPEQP